MSVSALLVGASPCGIGPQELKSLAHHSQVRVAIDGGAAALLGAGVVPDVVVGDLDSLGSGIVEDLRQAGVAFDVHPADKDVTDLDLAFEWCRRSAVARVSISHVLGGRLDHTLAALGSIVSAADLRPVVYTPIETVRVGAAEHESTLSGFAVGDTLSVIAIGASAVVSARGVRWPLEHRRLTPNSSLGVSNQVTAESASIFVHDGTVLVTVLNADDRP